MKKVFKKISSLVAALSVVASMIPAVTVSADSLYIHRDEDAALDTNWTKVEEYDEKHGNVYKFAPGANYDGTTWFTEEFADGTYVVSMDFKMSGEMTEGISQIIVDSETWQDRTSFRMYAENSAAVIAVEDPSGVKLNSYFATYNNHWDVWNNYSIVYEKNGTDVDVTQYLNGIKLHDAVRVSDNFRFKRITVVAQGGVDFYLDNIVCRKISGESLKIESVKSVLNAGSSSNVGTLLVKYNQPLDTETVSSVTATKSDGTNIAVGYKILGQYLDITVQNLYIEEGYTITVNQGTKSIAGNTISNNTYTKSGQSSSIRYILRDEDGAADAKWSKLEKYDSQHGSVYHFAPNATYDGTEWFSSEFADGTYLVSMDFTIEGTMAKDTISSILVDSEDHTDRTSFLMHANGGAAIAVQDSSGVKLDTTYARYGNNWSTWNNYSIVYEKNGTNVDVTQYLNDIKLHDAVRISDNFRFKRITVVEAGGANLYLDNIVCRKISGESLEIERIIPILRSSSGTGIKTLAVKFNQPLKTDVSGISVVKSGSSENIVKSYTVLGQYVYANVRNLEMGTEVTFSIGEGAEAITGSSIVTNTYTKVLQAAQGTAVSYLHKDEDALLDTKWTKETNYDAEHGNVYKFAPGANYDGTTWFTEEFADGTYVVSMDFKMSGAMTADTASQILVDSETWQDRTSFHMHANGGAAIAVQDASGVKLGTTYARYGNNWTTWNNYSIVYEKNGTDVDVTQYLNGRKLHDAVRISDNFRFKRMTIVAQGGVNLYLDNITCRSIPLDEKFNIESVELNNNVVAVRLNQQVNADTITSVNVTKDGSQSNIATGYSTDGKNIYVTVNNLGEDDGFTVTFNNGVRSIVGLGLVKSSYKKAPAYSDTIAYWVCDGTSEQNFEEVKNIGGSSFVTVGGKKCLNVSDEIKFELSTAIKSAEFDGSEYQFEIVYYDGASAEANSEGNANFFQLMYEALDGNDINYDNIVYKNGTGAWKTATITVDDINLGDSNSSDCDFKISAKGVLPQEGYYTDRASAHPIQIHSVRITRTISKNPVFVTTVTNSSSNSFAWFDKNKQIVNTYKNVSGVNKSVKAITKIFDASNNKCFENIENLTINADATTVSTINFGSLKKCGVFRVVTEIVVGDVTVSSFETAKVAILKTDPNGVKDNNIFISVNSERYGMAQQETAANILSLMNVAGARVNISWDDMLAKNSQDEYELDWNSNKNKYFVSLLKEKGMTSLGVMGGTPSKSRDADSPGYMCMPVSNAEIAAFSQYAEYVGTNVVKDGFSYIEFFNEPNTKNFINNIEAASGTEFAKVAISAKSALINAATNAGVTNLKVAGPGVTGINQNASYTSAHLTTDGGRGGYDYLQQAVNAGYANNFDSVSFHNYTWDDGEQIRLSSINNIKRLWTNKGLASPNLWITEAGYYKGATYSKTDRMQGAQNIRQILTHKVKGVFGDVYNIYALERKGYNPEFRESNFGLINPLYGDLKMNSCYGLPTEGAIMIAAMNYVMPNAQFVKTSSIELDDDEIIVSKFTSDKWEGKQIITAYNVDNRSVSSIIDLGVNRVKCFDEFGNETMLTSSNGKYNVQFSEAPIYFVADFDGAGSAEPKLSIVSNGIVYGREELSEQIIDFSNFGFEIENAGQLTSNFTVITSFYKDNALVKTDLLPCNSTAIVNNKITISGHSIAGVPEYDEVKFTIWDSLVHMQPLIKIWECK